MSGFTPAEGERLISRLAFKRDLTDRIADLELGLFCNTPVDGTITEAALVEPVGAGYARKTLTDANWTGSGASLNYASQQFLAGVGGWSGEVQGYFICTKGATKRILIIEVDPEGPFLFNEGDSYDVVPNAVTA